jgi:PKD domain
MELTSQVRVAVRAPSQDWKLTVLRSGVQTIDRRLADITCDDNGNAVAVWAQRDGIWSSIRPGSGDWEPPSQVAQPQTLPLGQAFSVGLDGNGTGVALWASGFYDPGSRQTIELSELRPNGPILQRLTLPRPTRVGVAGRFTVRAFPWGSSFQRIRWQFGDGTAANGARVTHRYRDAGKYAVTVSARDAAGFTTALNGSVQIRRR